MHLLAISLLTILAGTLLLAKFRKDMPGKFFAFISWFFIVVGFILFIGFVAGGICKMKHHCCPGQNECRQEMMKDFRHGMPGGFFRHQGMERGGPCCPPGMGRGGPGCPPGMDKGDPCCPPGMDKGMCAPKPGCMPQEGTMKCCPKQVVCDTAHMPVPKK